MAVFQIVAPILKLEPKRQGVSQRTGNPWTSQTVILDCSRTTQMGQTFYQYIAVDFFGDEKISLINGLQQGNMVQVSFSIESRERQTQTGGTFWSANINGISIKPFVQQNPQMQIQPQPQAPIQQMQPQAPSYQQPTAAYQQPPQAPAQNYGQQPVPQPQQQGVVQQENLPF